MSPYFINLFPSIVLFVRFLQFFKDKRNFPKKISNFAKGLLRTFPSTRG